MKDWWNKKLAIRAFYLFLAGAAIILFWLMIDNMGNFFGIIGKFFGAISSFFIGFAIAYILNPAYMMLRRNVFKRLMPNAKTKVVKALSIAVLYVLVLGLITVLLYLVLPQLGRSIAECVNNLIQNYDTYYKAVDEFISGITGENNVLSNVIASASAALFDWLKSIKINDLLAISNIASSVISSIFDILVGFIISIYMLYNK